MDSFEVSVYSTNYQQRKLIVTSIVPSMGLSWSCHSRNSDKWTSSFKSWNVRVAEFQTSHFSFSRRFIFRLVTMSTEKWWRGDDGDSVWVWGGTGEECDLRGGPAPCMYLSLPLNIWILWTIYSLHLFWAQFQCFRVSVFQCIWISVFQCFVCSDLVFGFQEFLLGISTFLGLILVGFSGFVFISFLFTFGFGYYILLALFIYDYY